MKPDSVSRRAISSTGHRCAAITLCSNGSQRGPSKEAHHEDPSKRHDSSDLGQRILQLVGFDMDERVPSERASHRAVRPCRAGDRAEFEPGGRVSLAGVGNELRHYVDPCDIRAPGAQIARRVPWAAAEVEDRTGDVPEVMVDQSQVVRVLMLPRAEEIDVEMRDRRVRVLNVALLHWPILGRDPDYRGSAPKTASQPAPRRPDLPRCGWAADFPSSPHEDAGAASVRREGRG
jgi:hypothetical protein